MIEQIRIINFRQIKEQTINLSSTVVIIGPNNGGKTTFLQAISLLALAIKKWREQRLEKKSQANQKVGVAINLEDIINIPLTEFRELWRDLTIRTSAKNEQGKSITNDILIEIHAHGFTHSTQWQVGFEFYYQRNSLIYTRLATDEKGTRYTFPKALLKENIGYLPSVAALKPFEDKLELGSILRYIGSGNTADVLRNICYYLFEHDKESGWKEFKEIIFRHFRIAINDPQYIPASGLIKMSYNEGDKKYLDLSALGSGSRQAILLFSYLLAFSDTIILLDEPDAHLEFIRQSNIYDEIHTLSTRYNSQIIIASHSESVLRRAFTKDRVISSLFGQFKPVRQPSDVESVLLKYGYEEFLIVKQIPRILYCEGSTDFNFIKALCDRLNLDKLRMFLENKIYYREVGNQPQQVKEHYGALKRSIPELKAYALFDNLGGNIESTQEGLYITQWERREIENYLPLPDVLYCYIREAKENNLSFLLYQQHHQEKFDKAIKDQTPPAALQDNNHIFWRNTKISDNYLTPLFEKFFKTIDYPKAIMDKAKYYQLINYAKPEQIDHEVVDKLQKIWRHLQSPMERSLAATD